MNSLNVKHQEKKVQSIGISPVSLQVFMKTLKNDISEAYEVQADCLKIMIKWYERESAWLGSLAQGSARKIKSSIIFRTNSNSYLYLINGLECTVQNILMSLNTLFELHMKSKK